VVLISKIDSRLGGHKRNNLFSTRSKESDYDKEFSENDVNAN
jgi:hypothetical protein